MYSSNSLATMILLVVGVFVLLPEAAQRLVAELKRRWRLYLIAAAGRREGEQIFGEFKQRATARGIGSDLIEEIVQAKYEAVCDELGRQRADEQLGPPTILERYF